MSRPNNAKPQISLNLPDGRLQCRLCPGDGSKSPQISFPSNFMLKIRSCYSMSISFNLLIFHVNLQIKCLLFIKSEVIGSVLKDYTVVTALQLSAGIFLCVHEEIKIIITIMIINYVLGF